MYDQCIYIVNVYYIVSIIIILVCIGNLIVNEEIEFMLISEPLSEDFQFTLTCISTGGPATIVTWTRDSVDAEGEAVTTLINATSAQYTHILTVTGRQLGGLYTCTVSNNIPSEDSTNVILNGMWNVPNSMIVIIIVHLYSCYTSH